MSKIKLGLLTAAIVSTTGVWMAATPVANADQPHMQAALRALETAENELAKADADKGGHRVKAIEHTRMAIAEVRAGITFDRRH